MCARHWIKVEISDVCICSLNLLFCFLTGLSRQLFGHRLAVVCLVGWVFGWSLVPTGIVLWCFSIHEPGFISKNFETKSRHGTPMNGIIRYSQAFSYPFTLHWEPIFWFVLDLSKIPCDCRNDDFHRKGQSDDIVIPSMWWPWKNKYNRGTRILIMVSFVHLPPILWRCWWKLLLFLICSVHGHMDPLQMISPPWWSMDWFSTGSFFVIFPSCFGFIRLEEIRFQKTFLVCFYKNSIFFLLLPSRAETFERIDRPRLHYDGMVFGIAMISFSTEARTGSNS